MSHPSVAIIIVNWNGAQDTVDCIDSLRKINPPAGGQNYKIFLIDNGSSDDSFSRFQSLYAGAKDIELIKVNENLGFSGGNNIGIKSALGARFDYILLLNNDTTVEPDFLNELVKVAEGDEKIGIVGPKIYYYNEPNRIWFGGGKFSWFGGGKHLQYDEMDNHPDETEPRKTAYMTGCALLIKSNVIEKIGLLEESFFMYYEDTDWCLRARKDGYKILYAPSAKIYHKVSRSAAKLGNSTIFYYHIRNALLISKRQAPKIILAGIYIWSGLHYFKQIIKIVIFPSTRDISKMIMRGIEDFYKNKFGQYQ